MLALLLSVFALVSTSLQSDYPSKSQICVRGCQISTYSVTFGTSDPEAWPDCHDNLRWGSIWLCAKTYCTAREIRAGVPYVSEGCDDIVSYDSVIANYSDEAIKAMPTLPDAEPPSDIMNTTVLPTREFFDLAYKTIANYADVSKQDDDYSWAILGFWGIVLVFGLANRLTALIVTWTVSRHPENTEAVSERRLPTSKSPFATVRQLTRRYVTLPATFGYRHQQAFGYCTLPTRIQSLMIFSYVLLNIVLSSVKYTSFPNNVYFATEGFQIWTYVTDRTGILAVVNLPLLWVFAGRNDVFLWLTGWNFGTFNMFHRWIARIVAAEAVIHSIGYTYLTLKEDGKEALAESFKEQYWYCGVVATICFSLLLLFSMYPIRLRTYELFLGLHVGLAVMALVTTYYHIIIWEGKFEPFIWPCVAVWSFDHAVRMARLAVLNYKVAFLRHTKVLAVYNQEHDIVRLTFTPSYHRQPQPGTHYYLHFPFILKAIGNHPFTMSGWSHDGKYSPPASIVNGMVGQYQEKGNASPTELEIDSDSQRSAEQKSGDMKIHFLLRPYKGLTAKLRDSIIKNGTNSREITALMEGPYGEPAPVFQFNTVIFVVGGSGVTAALPYMQEYLHPSSPQVSRSKITKRVHLLWTSREQSFVRDIVDVELAAASSHPNVKLDLYVTGSEPSRVKSELDLDRFPGGVGLNYQRPDVKRILHQEVRDSVGSVAIFVCGPAKIADDARKAAVELVGEGYDRIGYFEEQFGW